MKLSDLILEIKNKDSFLCIGLDTDINKIPKFLLKEEDPIFLFNKSIIDKTNPYCVAYKINTAFYESLGTSGWVSMKRTIDYINKNFPEIFTIADAKRGDIGNTSKMYAQTFFGNMNFDSVTINPYMGSDSVKPFLEFENKISILLGLTSNIGALDIQLKKANKDYVFIEMIKSSMIWGNEDNMMYVVGATKPQYIEKIRKLIPSHFLLIPGVGAQGGDLNEICKYAMNDNIGILVNSSRSIIYASNDKNFDHSAANESIKLQKQMKIILSQKNELEL
tara:strand:+ start:855 stop:1688 length:834 start_codon:yes stop_codon:yes gene_type:complete